MNWKSTLSGLISLLFLLFSSQIKAHELGTSYLYFSVYDEGINGRLQLHYEDLNEQFNLNLAKDFKIEDLTPHVDLIQRYVKSKLSFESALGKHTYSFGEPSLLELDNLGNYGVISLQLENLNTIPETMEVNYDIFFENNPKMTGMLLIAYDWKAGVISNEGIPSLIFTPSDTKQNLGLRDEESSVWNGLLVMIKLGIWHIWIGIDHILFLLALILPSVVRRKEEFAPVSVSSNNSNNSFFRRFKVPDNIWKPVAKFKPALIYVVKIITFFTIAHTITLSLAALSIVNLPSRPVESIIALSIALAAFHNIKPIIKGRDWIIAFAFGLFHGFGFASVLAEKGITGSYLVLSLLGFNLGVEVGQVIIIILIFPILYMLRKSKFYKYIVVYGSILLIMIALYWFIERSFDIDIPAMSTFKWVLNEMGM